MKTSITRFTLALALTALVGCSQLEKPVAPQANDAPQNLTAHSPSASAVDLTKIKAEFDRRVAEHQAVLAKKGKGGGKNKITVPDDYATIQDAVDAATEGAKINVKSGSYTEDVVVSTPNLEITASGKVTLNGSFTLNANGITIHKFKIVDPDNGVIGFSVSGAEIEDNTFSGGYFPIVFFGSTNCKIKGNKISGATNGIGLDNSDNNTIDENTVTNTGGDLGIVLQSGSDDNVVSGNTCKFFDFAGIWMLTSERNQLKDNVCTNNRYGIELVGSNNNTIGSDNTASANSQYGIYLHFNSSNNTIKKNKAKGNTTCDIFHDGSGSGNVLSKNKADCVSGF
jgi:parallel beta-helix repeat protein